MASLKSVHNLAEDPMKNVVLYINDYYDEYGKAFRGLATYLGRKLRGVMLVDKTLKEAGQNLPDTSGVFEEIVCDFSNDVELRAVIKQLEDNLLLVSCSAEKSQLAFQRVLPHVPYLPGPTERSLEWATHKGKMRELIGAYDAKLVPKVQPVVSAANEEIQRVLRRLSFPMIIKPTGLSDSALITKVSSEHELRTELRVAFAALHDTYSRNRGNGDPGIIVEEFMEGDQYTIDGYVNEYGKVWLLPLLRSKSAYHMGLEGFYTYQTETYNELTPEQDAAGQKAAEDAIHAIGLRSSIAHLDMYHTANGWKIIELGARPGAMRQEIYEVSYGVDHALNELLIKIGLEPEMGNGRLTHSMVFKVYPETEGEIDILEGIDEANRHPSVYKIFQFARPGDSILPITQGGSVVVQGVLYGNDVNRLREEVNQVRSAIKVKIVEPVTNHARHEGKLQPVA